MKSVNQLDPVIKYVKYYFKKHPDTLLIVTPDHETGGLTLPENATRSGLTDDLFTTSGHTMKRVQLFAFGKGSKSFKKDMDNTDVGKMIKKLLK